MAIFGEDFLLASQTLIDSRREARSQNAPWYRRLVGDTGKAHIARCLKRGTLTQLQQSGYQAEDIVESGLDIMCLERFRPAELHDFGFTLEMLLSMGFGGKQLRDFTWRELNLFGLKAENILNLSVTVHDILAMNLSVQQLHTLGFTRRNLQERGATPAMLEDAFGGEDAQMYLGGTAPVSVPRG